MYSNKVHRKLKQIIRDTLYTDIEFVRDRFINDDCPISIVVSAATRNKVANVGIKLLDAKRNKGKAPQTLVRRFLSLVNLHKYQLKLMTVNNVMSPQTLSTNLYALKVVTDSTIDLLMWQLFRLYIYILYNTLLHLFFKILLYNSILLNYDT